MRIGVDATSWANGRGYGRFTREILRALALLPELEHESHELVCFVEAENVFGFDLAGDSVRVRSVSLTGAPSRAASSAGHRSPIDMLRLTQAVRSEEIEVFFSPTVYTYFPLPPRLPACVCIHDVIAERFPELTLPTRKARLFWKAKVRLALFQARIVLTVSEFARHDIARVLGVDVERIRVASEAPSRTFRPSESQEEIAAAAGRAGLPDGARWIVYVGGFNPHKNVDLIVRAHAALVKEFSELHLLLVGTTTGDVFHGDGARIRAAIAELGTTERVHWCGFVADEELRHLHSGALALALPSACEGFGLPAVEAAACGAPVVATTESPLPELLEGGGVFVAPGDVGALEAAFRLLASDEGTRRECARRAFERAGNLSWASAARSTLAAIVEAAEGARV